jgi:hypothetical protein
LWSIGWISGWLDGAEFLKPAAEDRLRLWPVSRRVNKTGTYDHDPTLIDEVTILNREIEGETKTFLAHANRGNRKLIELGLRGQLRMALMAPLVVLPRL